jgi:thiamine-phosphate pyrophosphorylase
VTADGAFPPLTAILDADAASRAGWQLLDLAGAYLKGGARLLQVRAKNASGASFLEAASAIVALAHREGAVVIVNDRADIARISGADGVHVGQDDLAPAMVRAIVGDDAIVGLSTHTPEQLAAACHLDEFPQPFGLPQPPGFPPPLGTPRSTGAAGSPRAPVALSYVAIGPVFATTTKATGLDALGLDRVHAAAAVTRARGLPLVAIGGITLDRVAEVLRAGATSVAVISDLLSTGDPQARVRAYLLRLGGV